MSIKRTIVVGGIVGSLVLGGILTASLSGGVVGVSSTNEQQAESVKSTTGRIIAEIHDYYNGAVGYGNINVYKPSYKKDNETVKEYNAAWKTFTGEGTRNGKYFTLTKQVNEAIAATDNVTLRKDLELANELLLFAKKGRSADALIQLHRVFHDLDVHVNGADEDVYGVTFTGSGSNYIDEYLDEHFVSRDVFN
ncbi:hypothetical protein [Paenibacillus turpanensis]|uniref:hypothetical protein n=1 Tax=Paenibacillus turpanensis TaxID=2689078 RepID=UPI00140962A3|nr:hypothetical protein [Paenibacillus turpanensis]